MRIMRTCTEHQNRILLLYYYVFVTAGDKMIGMNKIVVY